MLLQKFLVFFVREEVQKAIIASNFISRFQLYFFEFSACSP